MVRIENSAVASFGNAKKFEGEMRRIGIRPEVARTTWDHELDHFFADPKKGRGGEFGYVIELKITGRLMFASFIAYYRPWGERDPEDLMSIAKAPGFSEMSSQDEYVYNYAWRSWKAKMHEEKQKADELPGEKKGKVHPLIAIPKRGDEDEEEYWDKVKLVKMFAEKLNKLEVEGKIPGIESLLSRDFSEIKKSSWNEVKRAYDEAVVQLIHEKNLKEGYK